jgi:hypothetical protein
MDYKDKANNKGKDKDNDSDNDYDNGCGDHSDLRFGFAAMLVERGVPGTFQNWRGQLTSAIDPETEQFGLAVAAGQGFEPGATLTGQLCPKSWLLSRQCAELVPGDCELVPDAIVGGETAIAEGVLSENLVLRTAFLSHPVFAGQGWFRVGSVFAELLHTDAVLASGTG